MDSETSRNMNTNSGNGRSTNYNKQTKRFKKTGSENTANRRDENDTTNVSDHDKQLFVSYQNELDTRNDRYERIVKISRDITIESKRIIFQLHRCTTGDDKENILKNAAERLSNLRSKQFYAIAKELINLDQNMYNRAITFGLQEFIEAWSFYTFLKEGTLLRLDEIACGLKFDMPHEGGDEQKNEGERCFVEVSIADYLLGLLDLGGELMRYAINKVASDNRAPNEVAEFMRMLYAQYLFVGTLRDNNNNKDFHDKLRVLRTSLMKVEYELYLLKVRCSEVPDEMKSNYMSSLCKYDMQNVAVEF